MDEVMVVLEAVVQTGWGIRVGVGYRAADNTRRVSVSVNRTTPFWYAMVIDGRVNDRRVQILKLRAGEGIRCGYQGEGGDEGSN
jgi:hypothetical protein